MTSIGQLRNMTPEQRTKAIAEHGPEWRRKLANLTNDKENRHG